MTRRSLLVRTASLAALAAGVTFTAQAEAQTFTDVGASLGYERVESANFAIFEALANQGVVDLEDFPNFPMKGRGAPGVAILDFDNDGDLDVYVTNGPATANSLFSNQLVETGSLGFVDVAVAAGADATAQDSTGVCFGDTDNDGDADMLVLGQNEPNVFLENNGDGTFSDVTAGSEIGGFGLGGASCSMGDVDGDGLLDITVANSFDFVNLFAILLDPFAYNHPNNLFMNTGDNTFVETSGPSGLISGPPNISWGGAMVDYDQDGDMDIMFADDQGAIPPAKYGGLDRGFIRVHQNDGTGQFTDVTHAAGLAQHGGWMGLSYADFDCDRNMDVYGANFGDYLFDVLPMPNAPGDNESRWFLGQADGTFVDTGPTNGFPTIPFGWGTSTADYDNDGDQDIFMHGGLNFAVWQEATNPGVILRNDGCSGNFTRDATAYTGGMNHSRREVHGMAMGDLDHDGFPDIVSVSAQDSPDPIPLVPLAPLGGAFDDSAFFTPVFIPIIVDPMEPPDMFVYAGFPFQRGGLAIEINSGVAGANHVSVDTLGTVGITSGGGVNRDGIGAIVTVTPRHGQPVSKPILGGSSYASQDALTQTFGLGNARRATVDILWPGGVRNRLYNVRKGRDVRFPEIPCSIDTTASFRKYVKCVHKSLWQIKKKGLITKRQKVHFFVSAVRAYIEEHHHH